MSVKACVSPPEEAAVTAGLVAGWLVDPKSSRGVVAATVCGDETRKGRKEEAKRWSSTGGEIRQDCILILAFDGFSLSV